ncbi:helix-turn-helix transcriptional regulator [Sporolactobacillus sp. Y61]|uniref:Helix-turn-helix transcriptional regulator n=1 Tax=Sporolactobacillus sp. Y61 TaxID=3160863 RepID=A0AAU8IIN1_9BACL
MGVADRYARHRSRRDPEFKRIWEDKDRRKRFELSSKIIELRLKMGLNQTKFAKVIGVKQPYLSRLENGDENITYDGLERLFNKAGATLKLKIEYNKDSV